jgi:hypothetical protein
MMMSSEIVLDRDLSGDLETEIGSLLLLAIVVVVVVVLAVG